MINLYKKIENWWFSWPKQLRFLLVGGFNTFFSYVLFLILEHWLEYRIALILTYMIAINLSIFTMRYYVFRAQGNLLKQYTKAGTTYLLLILINYFALWMMIDIYSFSPWFAQAVFTVVSTIFIYMMHNYINFRM